MHACRASHALDDWCTACTPPCIRNPCISPSCRPLKLRCGKRVVDYPIVLSNVDEVYKGVEEEHPGMHSIEEQFKTLRISEG